MPTVGIELLSINEGIEMSYKLHCPFMKPCALLCRDTKSVHEPKPNDDAKMQYHCVVAVIGAGGTAIRTPIVAAPGPIALRWLVIHQTMFRSNPGNTLLCEQSRISIPQLCHVLARSRVRTDRAAAR